MNVYDFDRTIYDGNCSVAFFRYALKQNLLLLRFLPKQAWGFLLSGLKCISKTRQQEYFFCFLSAIDGEAVVEDFWNHNGHRIFSWYLKRQKVNDMVISAAPEFLLRPICQRLGIGHLIASRVDPHSGKFSGKICSGKEKLRRLRAEDPQTRIDHLYAHSRTDLPLAQIAGRAYLVDKGNIKKWDR